MQTWLQTARRFVFIDISGILEGDEFLEKVADFDDSKLSHR
jgi:hypothetical protein